MLKRDFAILALAVALAAVYFIGSEAVSIPYLMFRTFLRMLGAYFLSIVFSVSVGLLIAHNERAFKFFFPILDILQSVPILGFLPFAVLFIIHAIPVFGSEVSTIFLIFTSMTWAVVFNVIEGARSIPGDVRDAARLNGIKGSNYLFHVLFPAIYGPVISGSITGWGGGWYFLVAGEYVTFGKQPPYVLPGVGSFIANSAYSGDIIHSLIGMGILALMVLFMNIFVWSPLLSRVGRFSYSQTGSSDYEVPQENAFTRFLDSAYAKIKNFSLSFFREKTARAMGFLRIDPAFYFEPRKGITRYDVGIGLFVVAAFLSLFILSARQTGEILTIGIFTSETLIRICVAYAVAVVWTVLFAVYLGRNKRILAVIMPFLDVAQSIPAIAVFPIIVVFVINTIGGGIGLEVASILLLLTGTQWYLLFNLIRAMQSIPNDLVDASSILKLGMRDKIRHVFLPAIFPAFIIGSMQAIGGAWNATIVSEYIVYNGQVLHVEGLGYLLDLAAANGDVVGILLSVLTMIALIIFLNKFIWRNALGRAEVYKL